MLDLEFVIVGDSMWEGKMDAAGEGWEGWLYLVVVKVDGIGG